MKEKEAAVLPPRVRDPWWKSALLWVPLAAAVNTVVIEAFNHKLFTEGGHSLLLFFQRYPLALLVNFLLVLVTLAPAFFLRRRFVYVLLLSSVWLIGGGVNGFIIMNRMTPFTTSDLAIFRTGLETLPNYLSKKYIVLLAVAIGVLLAALVLLGLFGPKSGKALRLRLVEGMLALAICSAALAGAWQWAFAANQLSTSFVNLAYAYEDYGFSYCFLQTWLNKGIHRPPLYSSADVGRILEEISANAKEPGAVQEDVNVIVIQLESFIDPEDVEGLTLSEDALPNWHALEDSCTSGYLTVPVVGAGTANTELEVLTGMSSRFFGPGEYPYETCLQEQTAESLAYDLKAVGYGTHAVHNHRATFYGRNTAYANLGFDDFTSIEYMPQADRTAINWAKDAILTDQILAALDSTQAQPDLVFTVSVQGHGKYPTEKVLQNPEITVETCPADTDSNAFEYYVNQIHEMDTFIGDLIAQLKQRQEKTVLVLYGDHLPSLNLESTDMVQRSIHKTSYVMWSNVGLYQADTDLYAYQLFPYVLGRLGITEGLINQFHQFCRSQPSYRVDLKELQYDLLYGKRWSAAGVEPYEPTEMRMGVQDITITGVQEFDGRWLISGTNFSPYCCVTVDGKQLDTTYLGTKALRVDDDPGTTDPGKLGIVVLDSRHEVLSTVEPKNP